MAARVLLPALAAAVLVGVQPPAVAGERLLRFHHFLPEASPQHREIYLPWAKRVAEAASGRLRIEVTPAMQLGGKPPELIAQVETGKVDIVWTVAGYTPGRFPRLEVFELPWIASSRGAATSRALYEFYEKHAREDARGVHMLAVWCHPSGVIMNRVRPMLKPADAAGRAVRVPSLVVGEALRNVGARPVLGSAPEAVRQLQAGTVDGMLFPYELIPTLKLGDKVRHITEFAGHRGLYTAVFVLAMSQRSYDSLDEDLRQVIDAHSGADLSAELGQIWDDLELAGRDAFAAAGGEVTFVKNDDYEAWVQASTPAIEGWKATVARAGIDGGKLIDAANALVAKYTLQARPY